MKRFVRTDISPCRLMRQDAFMNQKFCIRNPELLNMIWPCGGVQHGRQKAGERVHLRRQRLRHEQHHATGEEDHTERHLLRIHLRLPRKRLQRESRRPDPIYQYNALGQMIRVNGPHENAT